MTTPFDPETKRPGFIARLRNSFLTGIIVIAPVGLTVWLIWTVIGWVDSFVWPFVPDAYHPAEILNRWFELEGENRIEVNVRGLGVVVFLIFTILVGWIAKGLIGRSMINFGETLVDRTPVVRSIYSGIKQLAETVFAQSERSFEKACLIQYPRKGIWAIGFISTVARGEVAEKAENMGDLISVFVPTTPNPTSGFLLFFPREDVIELDMNIEDAAKLVISAGLVYPNGEKAKEAVEEQLRKAS
ncbi:hypothetical protein TRP8649_02561 [Pelagimonas phthalicica]|uniref:DUF502 domain-containing protein n=1 Tax=Pelagimonas phthalicica TaxID=1037362 RepID=A0A238JCJ8_9RHOB|nr:DUF502 domain-containing protein [Pelagimonas phthalicica]TDS91392.1 putative membrane protein [Pelagimonas phthalicica]SMX28441.1 hypothetical protein TRP8649_02561 [Pelagimonas phthalicica]